MPPLISRGEFGNALICNCPLAIPRLLLLRLFRLRRGAGGDFAEPLPLLERKQIYDRAVDIDSHLFT